MVRADVVAAKLAELADRVARVRAHRKGDADALAADRDALELVAFNLMLAVQVCADLASHVISDEKWPAPKNVGQSFAILRDHGVIDPSTAAALARAVGLRNVVAHGYAGIDPALAHAASTTGLDDLDSYARQVAAWAQARVAGGEA